MRLDGLVDADAIVVGAGLAGLAATAELARAGRRVLQEFALSGSEQNPDLTGKDIWLTLRRVRPGAPAPVEAFKRRGADFVVARTLPELVAGMNKRPPSH